MNTEAVPTISSLCASLGSAHLLLYSIKPVLQYLRSSLISNGQINSEWSWVLYKNMQLVPGCPPSQVCFPFSELEVCGYGMNTVNKDTGVNIAISDLGLYSICRAGASFIKRIYNFLILSMTYAENHISSYL